MDSGNVKAKGGAQDLLMVKRGFSGQEAVAWRSNVRLPRVRKDAVLARFFIELDDAHTDFVRAAFNSQRKDGYGFPL